MQALLAQGPALRALLGGGGMGRGRGGAGEKEFPEASALFPGCASAFTFKAF